MGEVLDRLRTTDWRAWLIGTVITGVVAGLMSGVDKQSLSQGVETGVTSGLGVGLFSVILSRDRKNEILPDLSDSDRATVVRTVREGSIVGDARLAPAVIAYTENLRAEITQKEASRRAEQLLFGFCVLVSAYFAVRGRWNGNNAAAVMWALLPGVMLASALIRPRRRERKLQRLERVEDSARAFLVSPW